MIMSTDYIVYLWLLPVTVFTVIPLLALNGWIMVQCIKYLAFNPKPMVEKSSGGEYENGLLPSDA